MSRDFAKTLNEIDEFYMKKGPVHQTLERLAVRLNEQRIAYAVIEGMALAAHGFVRPTEDVDVLMTPGGLEQFRTRLRDLADVQELIARLGLTREFAEGLDESVRQEYVRLWETMEGARRLGSARDRSPER